MMSNDTPRPGVRLTGFAAACLWHRRLLRPRALNAVSARPRISTGLVLRPLPRTSLKSTARSATRTDAGRHAA
jgi:hypothetical protein